ncbi:hypothetical protein TL16_g06019 [Triparma laevis f. inornata]|uniref:DUF2428 domain-containing protein n=1 Tax=Triparma laevis f. inornata TaxID=1714386 RepID=A0A9W7EBQ7_9STRA|nr:hypothetical protein TL16_g06019 [Triparma laevis f. inornata]
MKEKDKGKLIYERGIKSGDVEVVVKALKGVGEDVFLKEFKKACKSKNSNTSKELKLIIDRFKNRDILDKVIKEICRNNLYPGSCEFKEHTGLTFLNLITFNDSQVKFVLPYILESLGSLWDTSRSLGGRLLENIKGDNGGESLFEKGVEMAGSPRTRESDSGARILGLVGGSRFEKLLDITETRVNEMEKYLTNTETTLNSPNLPLAHGLLKALSTLTPKSPYNPRVFDTAIKAVKISLKIVSTSSDPLGDDLSPSYKDKGYVHGDYMSESQGVESFKASVESLNVNSGCLGTNGVVGGLEGLSVEEEKEKINVQRIVVGTWLLAKEGCTLITSSCVHSKNLPSFSIAGKILIDTITTLKHQGAASAAMGALEGLCVGAMEGGGKGLVGGWLEELIRVIGDPETGESTLRRSSGFGFGFLAILKAEARFNERELCGRAMESLVRMCLPPVEEIRMHEERVHALNIVRLLLLSTSLSHNLKPYYIICLQISLIGFTSHSWAVSNSCTMVFSASMGRAVDSDKNSRSWGRKGEGVNKAKGGDEVICGEFERFLECELKSRGIAEIDQNTSYYTILLLFSRLHPTKTFPNLISLTLKCLRSRNSKVRLMASMAIPCICVGEDMKGTFEGLMGALKNTKSYNERHGSLMCINELLKSNVTLYTPLSAVVKSLKGWLNDPIYRTNKGCMEVLCDLADTVIDLCGEGGEDANAIDGLIGSAIDYIRTVTVDDDTILCGVGLGRGSLKAGDLLVKICVLKNNIKLLHDLPYNFDLYVGVIKTIKKKITHETEAAVKVDGLGEFIERLCTKCVQTADFCCYEHEPSIRRLTNCLCQLKFKVKQENIDVFKSLLKGEEVSRWNCVEVLSLAVGCSDTVLEEVVNFAGDDLAKEDFRKTLRVLNSVNNLELVGRSFDVFKLIVNLSQDDDLEVRTMAGVCLGYVGNAEEGLRLAMRGRGDMGEVWRILMEEGLEGGGALLEEGGGGEEELDAIFEHLEPTTFYERLYIVHCCGVEVVGAAGGGGGVEVDGGDVEKLLALLRDVLKKGEELRKDFVSTCALITACIVGCLVRGGVGEGMKLLEFEVEAGREEGEIYKALRILNDVIEGKVGLECINDVCFLCY